MKNFKKLFLAMLAFMVIAITNPIQANAEWKQDSNGWWNTKGSSYSVGWEQIGGTWYYFDTNGYMVTGQKSIDGKTYTFNSSGVWLGEQQQTTTLGTMKIHYIDVGQGDSELIQVDGKNILIDAGTSDQKALNYIKSIGVTTLDYVIATHPHEDHIGSMDDVINTFNIGTFYSPKVTTTTKTYENMINALKSKNLKLTVPKVNDTLTIGNATLTFLAPNSATYEDLNNYSIVCKLKYGNTSFIFTGDAENVSESEILAKQLDIQANVIKIGHHGSTSSTTQAFLDKVNPQYAIISVGAGNDYGHPANTTLNKLNAKGVKTFRTDLNGTVIATSNGINITFNTNPIAATATNATVSNTSNTSNTTSVATTNTTITNTNPIQTTVWLANNNSKIYHYDKTCSGMKSPIQITLQEAQSRGCRPCEKCVN